MPLQTLSLPRQTRVHPVRKSSFSVALFTLIFGIGFCCQIASAQVTLKIINNFNPSAADAADYFGAHYSDSEVWLYFLNAAEAVTYTDSTTGMQQTVSDAAAFKLSDVQNGVFTLAVGSVSTKVFAGLGSDNPFHGVNGPQLFDKDVPYALAEWTINGNQYDNVDVTYEDSISFPTRLSVRDAGGTLTGQAGFKAGTQASDIVNHFKTRMPTTPTGPENANYPSEGAIGYGPQVETIEGNADAHRWIGSSKYWISAPGEQLPGDSPETPSSLRSMYTYAPSFNDYLGYLKAHAPTTETAAGIKVGWYIDYSGDSGYSAFVEVTGSAETGYGLQIHSIRVNTHANAENDWQADPNAGEVTTGTITIAANGETVSFGDETYVIGNWTDATIYSGASLINGDFASGPVVIATGDFAADGAHHDLVPTLLASISASMATGLLGSDLYTNAYKAPDPADRKGTMYWFNTMTIEQALNELFDKAWDEDSEFYDPYWAILAELTQMQGYLSPFNDRWSAFEADFSLVQGGSMSWELGLAQIPEPVTYAKIFSVLAAACLLLRRRRACPA